MLGEMETGRSPEHLLRAYALARDCGLFSDPELAAERAQCIA